MNRDQTASEASIQRPAGQRRINKLLERGLHKAGDVQNRRCI
jgi:hypothetical protein